MRICITIKLETEGRQKRLKFEFVRWLTSKGALVELESNPVTLWVEIPGGFPLKELCDLEYIDQVITSSKPS